MKESTVSIIITNYNGRKYIADALKSAQNQTHKNLEILVVDDCSTDGSTDIIQKAAAQDSRVKFLQTPKNSGGAGAPRNLGLDNATGEWVIFLDGDDLMTPTAVAGMVLQQQATGCDMVSAQFSKVPENFFIPKNAKFLDQNFDFDFWAKNYEFVNRLGHICICVVWGKLIRADMMTGLRFRTDIFPNEDVDFIMRLYARMERGGVVMKGLSNYYRQSDSSVIAQEWRDMSPDVVKVMESLGDFVSGVGNGHKHYIEFVRHYIYTFMRVWATNVYAKMIKPNVVGPGVPRHRNELREQMLRIAKCAKKLRRRGIFRGVKISRVERLALWLFTQGYVETSTLMFMVKY